MPLTKKHNHISVFYDVSGLAYPTYTGVGLYSAHLGRALLSQPNLQVTGVCKISRFLKRNFMKTHIPGINISAFQPPLGPALAGAQSVFHGPNFKVPQFCRAKKIVTVHDLAVFDTSFATSEFAQRGRQAFNQMMTKAQPDLIIAISEFTKNEIQNRYPQYIGRIEVVYHGADHLPANKPNNPYFDFPYIFYAGSLDKRKNIERIVKAFELIAPIYPDLRLVMSGPPSGNGYRQYLNRIKRSTYQKRIVLTGFVSTHTLSQLYAYASCFAYPSLYEGFGFPILEALKYGVPVVTSNRGALDEIGGRLALKADPEDANAIAAKLKQALDNENIKHKTKVLGPEYANSFTWDKCAQRTAMVYKKALSI